MRWADDHANARDGVAHHSAHPKCFVSLTPPPPFFFLNSTHAHMRTPPPTDRHTCDAPGSCSTRHTWRPMGSDDPSDTRGLPQKVSTRAVRTAHKNRPTHISRTASTHFLQIWQWWQRAGFGFRPENCNNSQCAPSPPPSPTSRPAVLPPTPRLVHMNTYTVCSTSKNLHRHAVRVLLAPIRRFLQRMLPAEFPVPRSHTARQTTVSITTQPGRVAAQRYSLAQ